MNQVGVGYSLVLPMALACYPAAVDYDHLLEVSQFLMWQDMHTEAFYSLVVFAFVAGAADAGDDDEESVEVTNNVL